MSNRKDNKQWAKHIINKFGKINAINFAKSNIKCPCNFLKWGCLFCKYQEWRSSCRIGHKYDEYINDDITFSLKRVKRRLKNIKKFILKAE